MHEKALMDDLLAKILAVAEAEGGGRVVGISVRLGALSHFTPGHFREHFDDAARGTLAEGAAIDAEVGTDPAAADAAGVVLQSVRVAVADGPDPGRRRLPPAG
jgi:hydrogenase nickel incorporation protein HypA/HybF